MWASAVSHIILIQALKKARFCAPCFFYLSCTNTIYVAIVWNIQVLHKQNRSTSNSLDLGYVELCKSGDGIYSGPKQNPGIDAEPLFRTYVRQWPFFVFFLFCSILVRLSVLSLNFLRNGLLAQFRVGFDYDRNFWRSIFFHFIFTFWKSIYSSYFTYCSKNIS